MDSPTGIIPEQYLYKSMRRAARAWLIAQPLPAHVKRSLLFAWARTVGVKLGRREVEQVIASGVEGTQES